jgi:hypothetical protein
MELFITVRKNEINILKDFDQKASQITRKSEQNDYNIKMIGIYIDYNQILLNYYSAIKKKSCIKNLESDERDEINNEQDELRVQRVNLMDLQKDQIDEQQANSTLGDGRRRGMQGQGLSVQAVYGDPYMNMIMGAKQMYDKLTGKKKGSGFYNYQAEYDRIDSKIPARYR